MYCHNEEIEKEYGKKLEKAYEQESKAKKERVKAMEIKKPSGGKLKGDSINDTTDNTEEKEKVT